MFCTYCHGEISPSHVKCPICGKAIEKADTSCPNCSSELQPDAVCCNSCGYHLLLQKVIKLTESEGAPPPPKTIICSNCKKEIEVNSRFCEFCGTDVHIQGSLVKPAAAPASPAASTPPPGARGGVVGFNEPTFNALIKTLDEKGIVSIEDLQSKVSSR